MGALLWKLTCRTKEREKSNWANNYLISIYFMKVWQTTLTTMSKTHNY
jgi:hypothetical protein